MCGIAGIFITQKSSKKIELKNNIRRMVKQINHRGPDFEGFDFKENLALGHARLSIIDLSDAGNQPMSSFDNQVKLVFNGEIYNFREIKEKLLRKGYKFKSSSDTEVLLNGYHCWGVDIFKELNGMFAFAIWDNYKKELILGRDQIGKKPLFYSWCDGNLFFSSEMKAILSLNEIEKKANLEAIHHYLTLQYVPEPYSAFKNIHKLEKAKYMIISQSGEFTTKRFWELPTPSRFPFRPVKDLKEELIFLLNNSVKNRMISDVPLGAFLSGGVDSSAVVALMAKNSSSRIKTFCIGFEEKEYDEREYAREVANRYNTDHHEMIVKPNAMEVLPKIVWHYNEPFADPSAIPTYYVSKIAREHVKVILNGDGGDENFLGYGRYKQCLDDEWVGKFPLFIRNYATHLSKNLSSKYEQYKLFRVFRRFVNRLGTQGSKRYAPSMAYFYDQDKELGYDENLIGFLNNSSLDIWERYFKRSPSYIGGAAYCDIHTYLPDDLLVKVDIASMAHGLEARSPFLDHKLMEWAAKINPMQKIFRGETKSILKSAFEPYLSKNILYRKKMGFGVPINEWIKDEMKDFFYDTLLSKKFLNRGLIKRNFIETCLDEHCREVRLHSTRLWALIMLELWYQMWID